MYSTDTVRKTLKKAAKAIKRHSLAGFLEAAAVAFFNISRNAPEI